MNGSKIEKQAKQLHRKWLNTHQDYVESCSGKPRIHMQSRDFSRAVEWKKLPEHWKDQYHREAKYNILNMEK